MPPISGRNDLVSHNRISDLFPHVRVYYRIVDPLLSEQMPEARGLTLTMGVLAISLSRIVMAPVSAWLMESISFTATCTVGAIGTACGVIVLGLWAKENEERED